MPDDSAAPVADELLLGAVDVARGALLEITPANTVGDVAGHLVEGDGVLSLLFENRLSGYPGWYWTVTLSREPGTDRVNVLEAELMPGDGALLAPEWVPWADRLAEWQAQQQAEREAAAAAGQQTDGSGDGAPDDDAEDLDDEDDLDEDDLDEDDIDEGLDEDVLDESAELQAAEEAALDESAELRAAEEAALDED
ncbi:DUF3027 domain-containing protein [Gryllotalpicola ginsengisoli]|uniref:DUF3027 domain-containing protein n=1 Tax=Gryllotalpicola ginsengisoli TaxID=444608 RepID=UPI0003B63A49|nr:DUF3027 domain-containing protein [Gryllotalpicola ginsengisoli]